MVRVGVGVGHEGAASQPSSVVTGGLNVPGTGFSTITPREV
jgi:hypothetical protein